MKGETKPANRTIIVTLTASIAQFFFKHWCTIYVFLEKTRRFIWSSRRRMELEENYGCDEIRNNSVFFASAWSVLCSVRFDHTFLFLLLFFRTTSTLQIGSPFLQLAVNVEEEEVEGENSMGNIFKVDETKQKTCVKRNNYMWTCPIVFSLRNANQFYSTHYPVCL